MMHGPEFAVRLCLAAVAWLASAAVVAQSPAPDAQPARDALPYAVSLLPGYRAGGSFKRVDTNETVRVDDHGSLAVAFDLPADDSMQYELFYARQSTQLASAGSALTPLTIEYLHLGGLVPLDETRRLQPYFGGGLGLARFSPDPALGADRTRFSISLALGLRVPVSRQASLRFEVRGFLTPIPKDSAFFCRSDQRGAFCQVHAQGPIFFQADLLAGAAFAF
jgi:opacity protein-like surface antigen